MTTPATHAAPDVTTRGDLPYGITPPGYRLPGDSHMGRVRLQVADLSRSVAYYERVVGLRVLHRDPGVATLGAHGDATPLVELHELAGATPVPRRGRLGLYHFAILLPDRSALGRFVRHLREVGVYAGMSDHLVSEAVYLTDPDGLGIEVYADRPRSLWRHDQRQIVMATEPLDVEAVVAAGGTEPWTGAPPGTVIGHVHLFVSELEAASAFYHAGLGFDKVVWNYPGALFLSAGGYHHHLGTNTWAAGAPTAGPNDAKLLDWELVVPTADDAAEAARSLANAGVHANADADGAWAAVDPWGTTVRIVTATPTP
jgi:catechol 2,3-dioxygenase